MIDDKGISQKERREVLKNDRLVRQGSTYFQHAQASIDDELRGRFAQSGQSATVTGSSPISYPKQPSTSPANQMSMMPDEAPLGYRVDDQEPVGEKFEVAASLGGAAGPGSSDGATRPKSRMRRL
jgi:hypothetical protein